MLVVYHHARDRLPGFSEALPSPFGEAGVDLFFVISGFIMVITTSAPPVRPRTFMLRRIARIVPSYWFYTTLLAGFVVLGPAVLNIQVTLPHYIDSLLFIPQSDPVGSLLMPLLQPGWTLNFEMFFYAIFAMTLFASAAAHRVSILVLTLTALVAAGWILEPSGPLLDTYTSPLLLEFAFGAIIGQLYATGGLERFARPVGWQMIFAGVAICALGATYIVPQPMLDFQTEPLRVATYGLGGALVVVGALSLESRGTHAKPRPLLRWLQLLGDASYALYLTHLFPIAVVRIVWVKSGMGTEGLSWTIAFLAVALPTAAAVGILTYWLLERPLTRAAQRMLLGAGGARTPPRSLPGQVG